MSLPLKALDRLWDRLMATYGAAFLSKYAGVDTATVKSVWAHELAGFGGRLEAVAWALENLPERAPNAIEFRNLCRLMPRPDALRLPDVTPDPARVSEEMAKLGGVRERVLSGKSSGRDWAHALKDRQTRGERLTLAQRTMMKAVLNEQPAEVLA